MSIRGGKKKKEKRPSNGKAHGTAAASVLAEPLLEQT